MNKIQGVTASAIIAAGLMLRPAVSVPVGPVVAHDSRPPATEESNKSNEEGPWLASCEYWKSARPSEPEVKDKEAAVSISLEEHDSGRANATVVESAAGRTSPCPASPSGQAAQWGIPKPSGSLRPEIHAIIAAVRDPLRGHHALDFDRDVDALVQAAGENGYVPSYYWLPWKSRAENSRLEGSANNDGTSEKSARERRPGLIVFKYVPKKKDEPGYPWSNYYKVIYLFLVGETSTLGMDGAQLDNAFRYESELQRSYPDTTFSMKAADELSIIGPISSGSAASLRERLEGIFGKLSVNIAGSTATALAADLLSKPQPGVSHAARKINYISFGENSHFELNQLLSKLSCSGYHLERVAVLSEDSTVYGASEANTGEGDKSKCAPTGVPVVIRFPREISLLRNAHTDGGEASRPQSIPSPFLQLSLKDPGTSDSVPQFSPDQMPLSQEAQLMAISRQLVRNRTEFVVIIASNVLDQLFLAQFLHRANPDAHLLFFGGDLLYERATENVPFIGTVTLSPYNLMGLASASGSDGPMRAFSDSGTEAYFNAASYTFWDGKSATTEPSIHLANYTSPFFPVGPGRPPLWATVIGTDGYYPLGIVNESGSNSTHILPTTADMFPFTADSHASPQPTTVAAGSGSRDSFLTRFKRLFRFSDPHYKDRPYRYPALSWQVLCVLIGLLCVFHTLAISFPNYWSPLTRDLAIAQGDQPDRRSMYIHIGTAMLFCMAFVTGYPLFPSFRFIHPNWPTVCYSLWAVGAAFAALWVTWRKTHAHLKWWNVSEKVKSEKCRMEQFGIWFEENLISFFNTAAALALLSVPALWVTICHIERKHSYVGWSFSYRCLHPGSGVSPLVPVLFILFGWYIWAVLQGLRLRFSEKTRPHLPQHVARKSPWPLFVSDEAITGGDGVSNSSLASNITCLLITREVIKGFFPRAKWWPTLCLVGLYLGLFCALIFGLKLESVDRFLWQPGSLPTPYELLIGTLAFPLIFIGLAGWLRAILIWGSLRRGLLEPLEQLPIRNAFDRLQPVGWMSMMRQDGLLEQWRDMARSTESMRQMVHDPALLNEFHPNHESQKKVMVEVQKKLDSRITHIYAAIEAEKENSETQSQEVKQAGLNCMYEIERCYADFSKALLEGVLIPYWEDTRIGLANGRGKKEDHDEVPVEARNIPKVETIRKPYSPLQLHRSSAAEKPLDIRVDEEPHQISVGQEPLHIRVAEEFLAIRYVSLIRAVLVNMRYLLMFVSAVFVVTIVAWNSYPFQPRQWMDEAFTGLLLLLGTGVIWVFVQMYRNPLLSRITDTTANELGGDFYLRMVTFGAVPVLTWLAYQFPEFASSMLRFIQPALEVIK
jgi:hypothetical protein